MCYPSCWNKTERKHVNTQIRCPYCNCITTKKDGTKNGKQKYRCLNQACGKYWTIGSKRVNKERIWEKFLKGFEISEIARSEHTSTRTIGRAIKDIPQINWLKTNNPNEVKVVIIDATYWGWRCGEMVAVDAWSGKVLFSQRLSNKETLDNYRLTLVNLSKLGYVGIKVVVTDGRPGVENLVTSYGLLYQKCQFHQIKTIIQYLTSRPKLRPNRQLLTIVESMTRLPKQTFQELLQIWYVTYEPWFNEKTTLSNGKRQYVHRKTRSAYRSLIRNLDALFLCRQMPHLHIPNTTNKLEGMFGNIKPVMATHRGIHRDTKLKVFEYLCLESR